MEKYLKPEQLASAFTRIAFAVVMIWMLMNDVIEIPGASEHIRMSALQAFQIMVLFGVVTLLVRIPGLLGRLFMFMVDLILICWASYVLRDFSHLPAYGLLPLFFAHSYNMEVPDQMVSGVAGLGGLAMIFLFVPETMVQGIERFVLSALLFVGLGVIAYLIGSAMDLAKVTDRLIASEERCARLETELAHMQTKLLSETVFDPVTGLYNFRFFKKRLDEELSRAAREDEELTLILVGVDRLEAFNGMYGRDEGDRALKKIGELLLKYVRDTDLVARYIDDQFFALFPNTGPRNALYPAMRIREGIAKASLSPDGRFDFSVGIGSATFPDDCREATELATLASTALKRSKAKGSNKITQYSAAKGGESAE